MPHRLVARKPRRFGMRYLPILAVACLGIAGAIATWLTVSTWEERFYRQTFNNIADDYATVLQTGVHEYLDKMRAVRAFYDSSNQVDPEEFDRFTDQILAGYSSTMRLVWCPRVTRAERAAFERKQQAAGHGDFAIRTWAAAGPMLPAAERDEYCPT